MMTVIGDYNTRGPAALYSVTLHEIPICGLPMIVSTDERRHSWIDEGYTVFQTDSGKQDFLPNLNHYELTRQSYLRFARSGQEGEMMRWSDYHKHRNGISDCHRNQKPATILAALRGSAGRRDLLSDSQGTYFQVWAFKKMSPWDWFAFI